MSKILEEYGPDSATPEHPRATEGGCKHAHGNIPNYAHPVTPGYSHHDREAPGLGQANNYGNCGTQQRSSESIQTSGRPGIHHTTGGEHHGHGTNRKGR
jgi:hypothetical protein